MGADHDWQFWGAGHALKKACMTHKTGAEALETSDFIGECAKHDFKGF